MTGLSVSGKYFGANVLHNFDWLRWNFVCFSNVKAEYLRHIFRWLGLQSAELCAHRHIVHCRDVKWPSLIVLVSLDRTELFKYKVILLFVKHWYFFPVTVRGLSPWNYSVLVKKSSNLYIHSVLPSSHAEVLKVSGLVRFTV